MNAESLEVLLEQLTQGDESAAARIFAAYEPFLRTIVRRSLPDRFRAKFDSADVVQSAWVQVLDGLRREVWQFADESGWRGMLAMVARRRLISRFRHHEKAIDKEEAGATELDRLPDSGQSRPSELAQAAELWEQMLALCPPAHHEVLRYKRQGFPLAEIAARTGLHEGSIRRILRCLARQLALQREPLTPPQREFVGGRP